MWKLTSENLSNLGGPMGSEYTKTNWVKCFSNLEAAKCYAENDFKEQAPDRKFGKWMAVGNQIQSEDLLFVEYYIERVKVEN